MSPHRLTLFLAAGFAAVWIAATALVVATASLPASASGRMLAIFPPGLPAETIARRIVDAGGIPVEPGAVGWIVYSRADGFAGRLREFGAWLTIPPVGDLSFAGICGAGMELLARRQTSAASIRAARAAPSSSTSR